MPATIIPKPGSSGGSGSSSFNYRGAIAGSTSYAVGDIAVYRGRRILVTTAFTTSSAPVTFVSAANYIPWEPEHAFHVADFGSLSGTTANLAIQAAINEAYNMSLGARVILPQGVFVVDTQIDILWGVILEGAGKMTTVIQPADASDITPIRVHKSTGSGNANAAFAGVRNLGINGRKATMSSATAHGMILETNPLTTGQSGTSGTHVEYFDPHNTIENVAIRSCKGIGLQMLGRSAHHIRDVWVDNCDDYGFQLTFDTTMIHCEAQSSGKAGFYINNGSTRLVGCKSYLNGRIDGGAGFEVGSNGNFANLSGCDSQNNGGPGYKVGAASAVVITGTSDGNGLLSYAFGSTQAVLLNGAVGAIINIGSINSPQNGVEVGAQRYGLRMNSCSKCAITMSNRAIAPATITGDIDPASDTSGGNIVAMNGDFIVPALERTANKGQASGYASLGSDGLVPSGQLPGGAGGAIFGNGFFGDGSDGTFTCDGSATPTWASRSGSVYTLTKDAYLDTLTINSGVTLRSAGYKLYVKTLLTNNGTIHGNGNNASGATAGPAAFGQSLNGGAAGGAGTTTNGGNGTGANPGHGGSGGAGGIGSGGTAGTGGAIVAPTGGNIPNLRALPTAINGVFSPGTGTTVARVTGGGSGGAGSGDGTNAGGGGGGAGQNIIINAKVIGGTTGTISANGGNGGNGVGGNAGGGGGGGGGVLIINTTSITGQTTSANGGTPGNGVGTGTNGSAGSAGTVYTNVFV